MLYYLLLPGATAARATGYVERCQECLCRRATALRPTSANKHSLSLRSRPSPDSSPGPSPDSSPGPSPDSSPDSSPGPSPDSSPDSSPGSSPGSSPRLSPGSITYGCRPAVEGAPLCRARKLQNGHDAPTHDGARRKARLGIYPHLYIRHLPPPPLTLTLTLTRLSLSPSLTLTLPWPLTRGPPPPSPRRRRPCRRPLLAQRLCPPPPEAMAAASSPRQPQTVPQSHRGAHTKPSSLKGGNLPSPRYSRTALRARQFSKQGSTWSGWSGWSG